MSVRADTSKRIFGSVSHASPSGGLNARDMRYGEPLGCEWCRLGPNQRPRIRPAKKKARVTGGRVNKATSAPSKNIPGAFGKTRKRRKPENLSPGRVTIPAVTLSSGIALRAGI